MKYFFAFVLLLALDAGCKPKILSGADLQNKLIETMQEHLHKTLNPAVVFTVKDVIYYPDKITKSYRCEFHVDMRFGSKDTAGIVSAIISNDFTKVERTQ